MSFQNIVIILLFAGAIFYVGRMLYKSLYAKKGCGSDCKCGIDFSDIDPPKSRSEF